MERTIWMPSPAGIGWQHTIQDATLINYIAYVDMSEAKLWRVGLRLPFARVAQAIEAYLPIGPDTAPADPSSSPTGSIQFVVSWAEAEDGEPEIICKIAVRLVSELITEVRCNDLAPEDWPELKKLGFVRFSSESFFLMQWLIYAILIEAEAAGSEIAQAEQAEQEEVKQPEQEAIREPEIGDIDGGIKYWYIMNTLKPRGVTWTQVGKMVNASGNYLKGEPRLKFDAVYPEYRERYKKAVDARQKKRET